MLIAAEVQLSDWHAVIFITHRHTFSGTGMLLAASCQPSTTAEVSLRNHSLGDGSMPKVVV